MMKVYPPISSKITGILHGGDYNPEQWIATPEIWDEDIRLMKLSNCNTVTVGIFAWAALEPEEGRFKFGWLDTVMDKLAQNGLFAILATPSAARPAWMSQKYPEVLRTEANRVRILHSSRHNHCYTSPVYREKTLRINRLLAERYKDHPALIMWHISNEYGGECHCELCQAAFREWLKVKYENDLDKLNHAWWTGFWSHTFTDWSQIESPAPHGENEIHGLNLDWKRFVTHQTIDFYKNEIVPIRKLTPDIPVTTNFMGAYPGLDYWKFAKEVDVISWDSYPAWHTANKQPWELASETAFYHDINRSLKGGKPFMLMESTPSLVNWQPVNKLKRPGMHALSSLQVVAHGSDTVQYFQWRKSRGGTEKFHGAMVDHCGHENTRVFNDVKSLGSLLKKLSPVIGATVSPQVAVIYDWENRWAIDDCCALRDDKKLYLETCINHYRPFWQKGISVDVINADCDFSSYKLLIAPMLYMVKPGVAERIGEFVKNGGTLVTTYWSGMVDQNDLCFLGGFPGPLREVLGIWSEEIDSLYDADRNLAAFVAGNGFGIEGSFEAVDFCELIHTETAEVLARYGSDFYEGMPAITVNKFGSGKAYHMAARHGCEDLSRFYNSVAHSLGINGVLPANLPAGVTAQIRENEQNSYIFVLNFNDYDTEVDLGEFEAVSLISGNVIKHKLPIKSYGFDVLMK